MPRIDRQIPNPATRLNVINRFLHVLALLHNDNEEWNATSLAEIITLDEMENVVSDKSIRDSIKYIREELDIDINTIKGSKRTLLEEELEDEMLQRVATVYASFIVRDTAREEVLKNFLSRHQHIGLWILARLHFACLERQMIKIDYVSNRGHVNKGWEVYPLHMVFRTGNLYLVIQVPGEPRPRLLIVNKIENLQMCDEKYEGEVPTLEELFKDSLSGYLTDPAQVKEVTISYDRSIHSRLEQFLASLEPEYTDEGERCRAVFTSADDLSLCKQFLLFGDKLEILSPPELRETMTSLLKKALSVYEK